MVFRGDKYGKRRIGFELINRIYGNAYCRGIVFYLLQPYVFFELNIKDKNRGVMKDENPRGEK